MRIRDDTWLRWVVVVYCLPLLPFLSMMTSHYKLCYSSILLFPSSLPIGLILYLCVWSYHLEIVNRKYKCKILLLLTTSLIWLNCIGLIRSGCRPGILITFFWSCQCNVIILINTCLSNYVFGVALYILPMLYAYDSDYCVWLDLPEVLVIDNPLTLFPAKNILQRLHLSFVSFSFHLYMISILSTFIPLFIWCRSWYLFSEKPCTRWVLTALVWLWHWQNTS